MQYQITEANKKDLIEWLRSGKIERAVRALETLNPLYQPAIPITADDVTGERVTAFYQAKQPTWTGSRDDVLALLEEKGLL
jgi:hypothetical protein